MNRTASGTSRSSMGMQTLGRSLLTFIGVYGGSQAALIALFGFALRLPWRELLLVWLLLLWSGFVGVMGIRWARQSGQPPARRAAWFGVAVFTMSNLYMGSLVLSGVRMSLISNVTAVHGYLPGIVFGSAVAALAAYSVVRREP